MVRQTGGTHGHLPSLGGRGGGHRDTCAAGGYTWQRSSFFPDSELANRHVNRKGTLAVEWLSASASAGTPGQPPSLLGRGSG